MKGHAAETLALDLDEVPDCCEERFPGPFGDVVVAFIRVGVRLPGFNFVGPAHAGSSFWTGALGPSQRSFDGSVHGCVIA